VQVTGQFTSAGSPLSKASCVTVMSIKTDAPHDGHGEKRKCLAMTGKHIAERRIA